MYLGGNQITDIRPLKNLKQLRHIDLSHNNIKGIPLSNLTDAAALRGYFETLEEDNQEKLIGNYHVKINIVGSGNTGKTQLFNWLTGGAFQEERVVTHGTHVARYRVKDQDQATPYRASLWDFGGQSYQHGTHSLFLRPQDFYLVLFCIFQKMI